MNANGKLRMRLPLLFLIIAGLLLGSGVSASEFGPWSVQIVDSADMVGKYSSAALDAAGNPAISYYDQTNGDLKYAVWDGSTWVITTVDASKRNGGGNGWWYWGWGWGGNDHSGYMQYYHGTEKVGEYSSLAFDSNGNPRISYYDESKGDLKYAAWDGSTWVITTVDGTNYQKDGRRGCSWDGDNGKGLSHSISVGKYSSLALDSNDNPRISYYDQTNRDLKYAAWDGSKWVITTVDASKRTEDKGGWGWGWGWHQDDDYLRFYHGTGTVGEYSSLALDSNNNPRISYHDESNEDLKYAAWDGSKWVITTVDGTNYKKGSQKGCNWDWDHHRWAYNTIRVGSYSSLALDSNGRPAISYYDETNRDLKYASWDGSKWVIKTVDSAGQVGEFSSLELDEANSPRISYYDATKGDLKFAGWNSTSSTWVTETVDNAKRVGTYTSLVLDNLGNPGISYYDQKNRDLKYTCGTGHTPKPPTVTGILPENGTVNGGTEVTITGKKLTGTTTVTFGGTAATDFTVVSDTKITATTPAHAEGAVEVVVTAPSGSATGTFTYEAEIITPTVTGISPESGTVKGGTEVTITGKKLTGTTTVTFGGTAATDFTVVSDTKITATTPAHAEGAVEVVVTAPGGSATGTFTYETAVAPTITSIDPASGVAGTTVAITNLAGTGFVVGTTPEVWLTKEGEDHINATDVQVVSSTKITCSIALTPYKATIPGRWDVYVQNEDGQSGSLGSAFQITNPAPTVTSIEPPSGQNGTVIDIVKVMGTNFGFGTNPNIWLAKKGAANITADDTEIYGTTQLSFRLNIPDSAPAGDWDLYVQSRDGQTGAYLGMFTVTYKNPSILTWDWSAKGWDGWETSSSWMGTETGDCTIVGPLVESGHGIYGTNVSLVQSGSTKSTVTRTFTAASGEKWSSLTFTGLLSSSDSPSKRVMTITVNDENVYSSTAAADPAINGKQFTITKSFAAANVVTVAITTQQTQTKSTSLYTTQFDSLTLN